MDTENLPKVLIVDDEMVVRDSLAVWLEDDGFQVRTAENGMQGLTVIEQEHLDAAVIDIKMPGMDGVTLLNKVKEIDAELPIIMITAHATIDNAVKSMKEGAYDFITKPFPPEKLSLTLKRVVEHRRLKEENIRLKKERRHILQMAISAVVTFTVIAIVMYFILGK